MDLSDAKISNAIDVLDKYIDSLDLDDNAKTNLHALSNMVTTQFYAKGVAKSLSMLSEDISEEEHFRSLCDKYEEEMEKELKKLSFKIIEGGTENASN